MFSLFSGARATASAGAWPKSAVVASLEERYHQVTHLKDDAGFSLYGVSENSLNFVVALVEVHGAPDQVTEVGFLTRFSGFDIHQHDVEFINRNLHISVCGMENGDLFLVGGVQAAGMFNPSSFAMILEAWKRDIMMVLQSLSGGASMLSAFPAARSEAVQKFATNNAPSSPDAAGGSSKDLFQAFFGAGARKALCTTCEGRGKQGFIARPCETCGGDGLISAPRH